MSTPDEEVSKTPGTTTPNPSHDPAQAATAAELGMVISTELRNAPWLAARRILLVEDNEDARNVVSFHLKRMALVVTTARDGQEACELAQYAFDRGHPYDWILMDMQMPVLDGYEATRSLRSRGYDRPIIAMTAYALEQDRQECLGVGCNAHVTKPIDWNQLATILGANLA
jgi:CheY-like chemotaxis protein